MHRRSLQAILFALLLLPLPDAPAQDRLAVGSKVPLVDLPLPGVDGDTITLAAAAGENGLLVLFSSNTCPWVDAWEDRYRVVAETARSLGIGMVVVNPNAGYRDRGDGPAEMRARAEEKGYAFPYVVDPDHRLADAFGAERTPEVFLFDGTLTLVYEGAIDDSPRDPEAVQQPYLLDALHALAEGRPVPAASTRSMGCTIRRTQD
ncbi:thioredoxin family protein [Rhodocaloribacter litoris]|uniref:thioredoxin family protein n=1 Tax=Rhodocaloribacter litoris TaxID=2558931 RepID=UPI00141E2301|nr:thioredoxin family protein [Rhodocaloribacter litoris]QXD13806.1 thioredoxin family protein [Rhodocaloribacter litoris]